MDCIIIALYELKRTGPWLSTQTIKPMGKITIRVRTQVRTTVRTTVKPIRK